MKMQERDFIFLLVSIFHEKTKSNRVDRVTILLSRNTIKNLKMSHTLWGRWTLVYLEPVPRVRATKPTIRNTDQIAK